MNITDLPFNRFIGIAAASKSGTVLSLPDDIRYTNHLGTVHASALLALAEATSGAYLIEQFAGLGLDLLPVVRRVEAKFRNPARGAIFSTTTALSKEKREEFISTVTERGRALLEIKVDVHDEHGIHALAASFDWFVARRT